MEKVNVTFASQNKKCYVCVTFINKTTPWK